MGLCCITATVVIHCKQWHETDSFYVVLERLLLKERGIAMDVKKIIKNICIFFCAVLITAAGYCLLQKDMKKEGRLERAVATATPAPGTTSLKEEMAYEKQIDLNTASVTELMELPKIGAALAKRIVAYREQTPFKVVRDVKKVSGIGDGIFESIRPYICVGR